MQDRGDRVGEVARLLTFETPISHNGLLKSERAAGSFPGIESKQLLSVFFSSSPPSSFLPVRPLQVPRYLTANTGIHEPCTSTALWKRKPLCSSYWKASSVVLCAPGGDEGAPARRAGFVTKATCWAEQPVVRQERSLWRTQVLGMPVCRRCCADWTPVQL